MRILITGATGLIGSRLVADRLERGDEVHALSRDVARAAETLGPGVTVVEGDPGRTGNWQAHVDGMDAVVHLAGASLADRRWSRAYKAIIRSSRVDGTRHVAEAIEQAKHPPGVLVAASAVGWYGDTGSVAVDESAAAAGDFLGRLCAEWEAASGAVTKARLVQLRLGAVLDSKGGALGKMLPVFRLGIAGPLGNGRQFMPWIHWADLVRLVDLALTDDRLSGPVNAVAPEAVTNRTFTTALAKAVRRPALLPVPGPALRLAIGGMAQAVLASQRVVPRAALDAGFEFEYPELEPALADLLGG